MQSRKDTRKSKPHSEWQEKSAIGACNERHPQSQYSVTRKSNNLSAKWLLSRKGYNPFDVYVFVQPRFFSDNCISQSAEYSGTRQRRIVCLPYDYLNRHT